MDNNVLNISNALFDLAGASEVVLYTTPKARAALKDAKLESAQRSLLERIDGFRSIEQVLSMSGDLIGVHGALGKLMASGCVTSDPHHDAGAVPSADDQPIAIAAAVNARLAAETGELENAKRLLQLEAKLVLGIMAAKLRPRIEACRSIEEIFDLIVKLQQHLATTGKANPDVFLDRLTTGLATARKKSSAKQRASR